MMQIPHIDTFQFGRMTINGKPFTTDLVILPTGKVIDNWIRKTGHFLEYNDIKALISAEPEHIIIGTGVSGRMQVDEKLLSLFDSQAIKVGINSNKRAVELYNQKIKTNQKVGACFHLTC